MNSPKPVWRYEFFGLGDSNTRAPLSSHDLRSDGMAVRTPVNCRPLASGPVLAADALRWLTLFNRCMLCCTYFYPPARLLLPRISDMPGASLGCILPEASILTESKYFVPRFPSYYVCELCWDHIDELIRSIVRLPLREFARFIESVAAHGSFDKLALRVDGVLNFPGCTDSEDYIHYRCIRRHFGISHLCPSCNHHIPLIDGAGWLMRWCHGHIFSIVSRGSSHYDSFFDFGLVNICRLCVLMLNALRMGRSVRLSVVDRVESRHLSWTTTILRNSFTDVRVIAVDPSLEDTDFLHQFQLMVKDRELGIRDRYIYRLSADLEDPSGRAGTVTKRLNVALNPYLPVTRHPKLKKSVLWFDGSICYDVHTPESARRYIECLLRKPGPEDRE